MKIAWTGMKGVCLLLLGLATTAGERSVAADINMLSFTALAESSSTTNSGTPAASPFKDETAATPVNAATRAALVEPAVPMDAPCCAAGTACDNDNFCGAPGRFWFHGDYLHWWTSGAHLPPLVSTVSNLQNPLGSLENVFGGGDNRNGDHEGYRMDFGMWLDSGHCWGLEADYFDVTGKPDNYDSGLSNGFNNGTPYPIVQAFFDPVLGKQINGIGYPNQDVGRITVDTGDYFQSAGIWLRRQLRASEWSTNGDAVDWMNSSARTFRLDAIAGYRFARLLDFANERDQEMGINSASSDYLVEFTFADNYSAANTFNGAELGFDAVYTMGRWSLDVVGKTALGATNQLVTLYGLEIQDASNRGIAPAQASVTETYSRNRFSAIPQLTVTGGYQLTDHVKLTAGYDLLYWSAVVRAANQIAVEPTTGLPYGTLVGSPLPAFNFNETYFFAQGFRLGAEVRF